MSPMGVCRVTTGALLALGASVGGAAHVTDRLAVGIYDAPQGIGDPRRVLVSGTPVEMLEQNQGMCQVRLGDGDEGWLECRYLTDEKPARVMLLEAQAEKSRLRERITALEDRLLQAQEQVQDLRLRLEDDNGGSGQTPLIGRRSAAPSWPLYTAAAVAGFALGALLFLWRCRRHLAVTPGHRAAP